MTQRSNAMACTATATLLAFTLPAVAAADGMGHSHADQPGLGHLADPDVTPDRVIEIVMTDNAFSIPELTVEAGETIRFEIVNAGEALHEFNIGTPHMHEEHREEMFEMMGAMPGPMTAAAMRHDHEDPNSVLLDPGERGSLTWTFDAAGELEFACNVPGHYESGMHGTLTVKEG